MYLTKEQIAVIHVAKQRTHLSEDDYRALLSGFNCASSKELTSEQFLPVMEAFHKLGFEQLPKENRTNRYGDKMASKKQQGFIRHLWNNSPAVRVKTEESLNHFIQRTCGVASINWLLSKDVNKVIMGIKKLGIPPKADN